MPITQARMLALIDAALDYQQATIAIEQHAAQAARLAETGAMPEIDALRGFHEYCRSMVNLLRRPMQSAATLAAESTHFKPSTIKRNNRVAFIQQRKRQGLGAPPRPEVAPSTIHQSNLEAARTIRAAEAAPELIPTPPAHDPSEHLRRPASMDADDAAQLESMMDEFLALARASPDTSAKPHSAKDDASASDGEPSPGEGKEPIPKPS